ncbi:hypothetical protein VNI00_015142 [Paramarasmius palmivorus]|uniref:Uncharacterized protein n=1 Tax=Paramarasmius palmivorus TaxID=297713 RepID=A0AAW0BNM6_9AGAR
MMISKLHVAMKDGDCVDVGTEFSVGGATHVLLHLSFTPFRFVREAGDPDSFGILAMNIDNQLKDHGQPVPIDFGEDEGEFEIQFPKAGQYLLKGIAEQTLSNGQQFTALTTGAQFSVASGGTLCDYDQFKGSGNPSQSETTSSPSTQGSTSRKHCNQDLHCITPKRDDKIEDYQYHPFDVGTLFELGVLNIEHYQSNFYRVRGYDKYPRDVSKHLKSGTLDDIFESDTQLFGR